MWKKQKSLQCTKKSVCFSKNITLIILTSKKSPITKCFRKILKPFFTDEIKEWILIKWIIFVEDDETISCWFYNKPEYLNIPQYEYPTVNTNGIIDPVLRAIEKYKNDSSIRLIKTNNENKHVSFRFQKIHAI